MKNTKFLAFYIALITCFLLASCQSNQQIAGSQHKLVVDKWRALSQYAYGVLNRYEISFGARLSVNKNDVEHPLELGEFTLLHKTSASQIDLLAPSFEKKLLCDPQCSLITEYVTNSAVNSTKLTQQFDKDEFKLFKFYGDLVLLEETFSSLEQLDSHLFPQYLHWLILQNARFDSLIELSDYLNVNLSEQAFTEFINDPSKVYSLLELDKSFDLITPESQKNNELVNLEPEAALIVDENWQDISEIDEAFAFETLVFDENYTETDYLAEKWPESAVRDDGIVATLISKTLDWGQLKTIDIEIGDQVCSFNENYFGFVTDVTGQEYSTYVIGEMQTENDNVLTNLPSGSAFTQPNEIKFKVIKASMVLNDNNIAPCKIALLNTNT